MTDTKHHFQKWANGYGVISHHESTQIWVQQTVNKLVQEGQDEATILSLFAAADRIVNAAIWLVAHQTYANRVNLQGTPLQTKDYKMNPQGHMGGSLNMVPAYVGYLLANALSNITRGWVMEQGHCVAAIDSVNLLLGNMRPEHAERYGLTDEGLTRYVNDFYSYRLNEKGRQDSPLGSHVNINTAGGSLEGGYLGFAGLQYIHLPLSDEHLVAFLSDGAFEEQRGTDWATHWWRAEDSGIVVPIMIFNGRRIDQRSIEAQGTGLTSFLQHLKTYHFDPIVFDGTDPAAFACMILEGEFLLEERKRCILEKEKSYPIILPYGVAVAQKGAGFYGAGTNAAHSLPLGTNPHLDLTARKHFNESVQKLFVPIPELINSCKILSNHSQSHRLQERDHIIANRQVNIKNYPNLFQGLNNITQTTSCPMAAIDTAFLAYVEANPDLRPRVGNPDEMLSNHMLKTLNHLKHRVTEIEPGVVEAIDGKVITVLNEEAVVCACLGNKAGINLIVSYEAFAPKMLGALRQELNWSDHLLSNNRKPGWISVPLILTSHTYENGKNERSHQDTTMCEALLGEPSDISRVLFPADYNSTMAALDCCYHSQGKIFTLVASKENVPAQFTEMQAKQLLEDGVIQIRSRMEGLSEANIILTAIGSYQLQQVLLAASRLLEKGIVAAVNYIVEPGRFRYARNPREAVSQASDSLRQQAYPPKILSRIFVSHTRPEVMAGILRPLDTGKQTQFLGFINQGGTLDTAGMLYVNCQTWAHIIGASANCLGIEREELLKPHEIAALNGQINPQGVII